jgi:hypothetical protein
MLEVLYRPDLRRSRVIQVMIDYALVIALVALAAAAIVPEFLASNFAAR